MTRPFASALLLCGLVAAVAPAQALAQATGQTAAQPAPSAAETVLTLSETAEVTRAPDEVRATLRAEARGANAAAVQTQVNGVMTRALERARAVEGVQAATGGYWTARNEENRNWTASQSLTLRGRDPAPLLELAGALQGQGMLMSGLDWSLSRPQEMTAREEAGRMAVEALQRRAEAVAAQLGLRVANLRRLEIDAPNTPAPRFRVAAMAARAEAAPPPVSAPEPVTVTATASAEFVLLR